MAFNFGTLNAYTDELSFELIGKAVLTTDLMEKIQVRTSLSAGTVAINLLDGDFNVGPRACGFTPSGDINFSQVDIVIADKQIKMEVCTNDLRQYYTSQYMNPSANAEDVVFEEVIADYYIQKIRKYNEGFLINGDTADATPGTTTGLKSQITGNATVPAGAAAWTVSNAIDQALDLYDAIDEAVKDMDDLIMVVSPANYRTLMRALVSQGDSGYYHYNFGDGQGPLVLPGTNCEVVKSSGLVGSNFVFAGPASFIIAGTGLESDQDSSFGMFYSPADDVVKVRAYWRLGVAVHQVALFAANDLA